MRRVRAQRHDWAAPPVRGDRQLRPARDGSADRTPCRSRASTPGCRRDRCGPRGRTAPRERRATSPSDRARGAHEVAASLARPPQECPHRAQRGEIAGRVVARGNRERPGRPTCSPATARPTVASARGSQRAGSVVLDEDVGLRRQRSHRPPSGPVVEIDERSELARARVDNAGLDISAGRRR
jgi:hypothetical protein